MDRPGILFDMGLSLSQCGFCIRTSDPKLLARLRANLADPYSITTTTRRRRSWWRIRIA